MDEVHIIVAASAGALAWLARGLQRPAAPPNDELRRAVVDTLRRVDRLLTVAESLLLYRGLGTQNRSFDFQGLATALFPNAAKQSGETQS